MSDEFNKPHGSIRMVKANDAEWRDRSIRLYKSGPDDWTLQLRSPIGLGTFGLRDGKDFIVASATCSLDDMRVIRDAIDAKIEEAEARGCCGENETGSGQHGDECSAQFIAGYHWADRLNKLADELCDVECTMAHVEELREIAAGLLGHGQDDPVKAPTRPEVIDASALRGYSAKETKRLRTLLGRVVYLEWKLDEGMSPRQRNFARADISAILWIVGELEKARGPLPEELHALRSAARCENTSDPQDPGRDER